MCLKCNHCSTFSIADIVGMSDNHAPYPIATCIKCILNLWNHAALYHSLSYKCLE